MDASHEPRGPDALRAEGADEVLQGLGGAGQPTETLPVLADGAALLGVRRVEAIVPRTSPSLAIPVAQAAAAAAGGFMAGAAVVGLVHRHQRRAELEKSRPRALRRLGRRGRAPAKGGELVQIVASRSLLVDVHLLGER
jgi:hypothetical protein